jgi:hypothetical protein
MLKEILSISGKPGLFKLISKGKNMFIAESLINQKRIPVYSNDKVVSLGDITMYTNEGDASLPRILQSIKQKENGEVIQFSSSITSDELRTYFSQILPDFDRDRVYPSDIKKVMNWYNLLVSTGLTEFEIEGDDKQASDENEENNDNKVENELDKEE